MLMKICLSPVLLVRNRSYVHGILTNGRVGTSVCKETRADRGMVMGYLSLEVEGSVHDRVSFYVLILLACALFVP